MMPIVRDWLVEPSIVYALELGISKGGIMTGEKLDLKPSPSVENTKSKWLARVEFFVFFFGSHRFSKLAWSNTGGQQQRRQLF
jgi:hypothetical protein